MTNIFGLHIQPRKNTRYNKIDAHVRWGEKEKEPKFFHSLELTMRGELCAFITVPNGSFPNMATTNIFGLHTQPRKTTRYTKKRSSFEVGEGKRAIRLLTKSFSIRRVETVSVC